MGTRGVRKAVCFLYASRSGGRHPAGWRFLARMNCATLIASAGLCVGIEFRKERRQVGDEVSHLYLELGARDDRIRSNTIQMHLYLTSVVSLQLPGRLIPARGVGESGVRAEIS